jgi:hypothetical protein
MISLRLLFLNEKERNVQRKHPFGIPRNHDNERFVFAFSFLCWKRNRTRKTLTGQNGKTTTPMIIGEVLIIWSLS